MVALIRGQGAFPAPRDATRGGVNGPAPPAQRGRERPLPIEEIKQVKVDLYVESMKFKYTAG
jgi:hypothetical protein